MNEEKTGKGKPFPDGVGNGCQDEEWEPTGYGTPGADRLRPADGADGRPVIRSNRHYGGESGGRLDPVFTL